MIPDSSGKNNFYFFFHTDFIYKIKSVKMTTSERKFFACFPGVLDIRLKSNKSVLLVEGFDGYILGRKKNKRSCGS